MLKGGHNFDTGDDLIRKAGIVMAKDIVKHDGRPPHGFSLFLADAL